MYFLCGAYTLGARPGRARGILGGEPLYGSKYYLFCHKNNYLCTLGLNLLAKTVLSKVCIVDAT